MKLARLALHAGIGAVLYTAAGGIAAACFVGGVVVSLKRKVDARRRSHDGRVTTASETSRAPRQTAERQDRFGPN